MNSTILWFRNDLRLTDNPALQAALAKNQGIVPIFIWTPEEEIPWQAGGASKWWLHQSLKALSQELKKKGTSLILRQGSSLKILKKLIKDTKATAVFWNRRYEPAIIKRDKKIKETLRAQKIEVESFNSDLLWEPWELKTKTGKPYQVFTPFWKAGLELPPPSLPQTAPKKIPGPPPLPNPLPRGEREYPTLEFKDLELEPKIDWAQGLRETWTPGEKGAEIELERFLKQGIQDYAEDRDRPDHLGTSRLSPHLHFGEISPGQVWHAVKNLPSLLRRGLRGGYPYLRQLAWREFAHHLLYHFPHTPQKPLREKFEKFPWRQNKKKLKAWQKGQTGYPIVDAGMRELWHTGWMHNRVRMIVASFLVKDLLIPWQEGAKWFWDTLVDADLANNTLGWQWVAGCGADASPFFRIFNPTSQAEKFDPNGDYIRRWVPELEKLPNKWIYEPWQAPKEVLAKAKIQLGKDYPKPMVDHQEARKEALTALNSLKS